jgi:hypothetical protein
VGFRKNRLTLDQHRELGKSLARIRDEVVDMSVLVSNSYLKNNGKQNLKAGNYLLKAYSLLDSARCYLECDLFNQFEADVASTHIYYPKR